MSDNEPSSDLLFEATFALEFLIANRHRLTEYDRSVLLANLKWTTVLLEYGNPAS